MVEGRRGGENFSVRLCRASGCLKALRVGGATVLEEGGTALSVGMDLSLPLVLVAATSSKSNLLPLDVVPPRAVGPTKHGAPTLGTY